MVIMHMQNVFQENTETEVYFSVFFIENLMNH